MPESQGSLTDWQNNPPKSNWDATRRSVLACVQDAEKALASLRSTVGEHPHDNPPDTRKILKMFDSARAARRHANYCDQLLDEYEYSNR